MNLPACGCNHHNTLHRWAHKHDFAYFHMFTEEGYIGVRELGAATLTLYHVSDDNNPGPPAERIRCTDVASVTTSAHTLTLTLTSPSCYNRTLTLTPAPDRVPLALAPERE